QCSGGGALSPGAEAGVRAIDPHPARRRGVRDVGGVEVGRIRRLLAVDDVGGAGVEAAVVGGERSADDDVGLAVAVQVLAAGDRGPRVVVGDGAVDSHPTRCLGGGDLGQVDVGGVGGPLAAD